MIRVIPVSRAPFRYTRATNLMHRDPHGAER